MNHPNYIVDIGPFPFNYGQLVLINFNYFQSIWFPVVLIAFSQHTWWQICQSIE